MIVVPIITFADLLPVTVSGIGARELLLIFFLSIVGIGAEAAVALSILYFIIGYVSVAVFGLFLFLREPIRLRDISRQVF